MGGFKQLTQAADGIQRTFENYFSGGVHYLHTGSNLSLRQMTINASTGSVTSPAVRTPAAMVGDELWQLDTIYDPIIGNAATLIAHPGRNLLDISSSENIPIYSGPSVGAGVLTANAGLEAVSGGVCVVGNFLMFFGNDGYFGWGGPNQIDNQTTAAGGGEAWPVSQKICAGFNHPSGNGPGGIYWSLSELLHTSFVGGTATWGFDTVSDRISIMSSRCMNTLDGMNFFWMGVNSFFAFNGQVQELVNNTNADWVFDNINREYRQKVFTFVNKRYGEVWFCFPFGSATECTHAVIYNARENIWYDTMLPGQGRSGGIDGGLYTYPILGDVEDVSGSYRVWQHEDGTDIDYWSSTSPIIAYIESSDISMLTGQQPTDKSISCIGVEPDILQTGDMSLTITGNANARATAKDAETITFSDTAASEAEQILRPKVERRQMRFRWESNTAGGNFELGFSLAHVGSGTPVKLVKP